MQDISPTIALLNDVNKFERRSTAIPPGMTNKFHFASESEITEPLLTGLTTGTQKIYLFGAFHYRDNFDKPHKKWFIMEYVPDAREFWQHKDYGYMD